MHTSLKHPVVLISDLGELLEKVTRVLTPEEQAIMDQEWVGRDGSKRKLEVGFLVFFRHVSI